MSCAAAAPVAGALKSWEPSRSGNSYWAQHNRQNVEGVLRCATPNYYHSPNAPTSYSYNLTHPYNMGFHGAPRTPFYEKEDHYYRFPQWGANYIYSRPYFFTEPKGACISGSGCFDNTTASACLYHPFIPGSTCKAVSQMGDLFKRDLSMTTQPAPSSTYGPWDNLQETWNDLMASWRYQRPAYNQ